jgi:hypothetical protein
VPVTAVLERGIVLHAARVTQLSEASMAREKKSSVLSQSYFESYAEYNRILRSWFVAFGVGGLALFLLESPVRATLLASGQTRAVVSLFLVGVIAQIVVAFLNKYANWYCYFGEDNPAFLDSSLYRFWSYIASLFWVDIILDILTVGCFLTAIGMLFDIFAR